MDEKRLSIADVKSIYKRLTPTEREQFYKQTMGIVKASEAKNSRQMKNCLKGYARADTLDQQAAAIIGAWSVMLAFDGLVLKGYAMQVAVDEVYFEIETLIRNRGLKPCEQPSGPVQLELFPS